MTLFEQAAGCGEPVRLSLAGRSFDLPGAAGLAKEVARAGRRYVLDDDARDACLALAEANGRGLAAVGAPALPPGGMWIEWQGEDEQGEAMRTAIFVRRDHGGKARMHLFREDASLGVELAEAHLNFDLDSPAEADEDGPGSTASGTTLILEPGWSDYFDRSATPAFARGSVLRRCHESLLPGLAILTGFLQLMARNRGIGARRHRLAAASLVSIGPSALPGPPIPLPAAIAGAKRRMTAQDLTAA